jgi:predicted transcriptional regulator
MAFGDNFFKKIENKTNVNKETILDLAKKIQIKDLKDEATLRDLIKDVSAVAGRTVTKEQEDKIINAVLEDKVPKDLDKFVE